MDLGEVSDSFPPLKHPMDSPAFEEKGVRRFGSWVEEKEANRVGFSKRMRRRWSYDERPNSTTKKEAEAEQPFFTQEAWDYRHSADRMKTRFEWHGREKGLCSTDLSRPHSPKVFMAGLSREYTSDDFAAIGYSNCVISRPSGCSNSARRMNYVLFPSELEMQRFLRNRCFQSAKGWRFVEPGHRNTADVVPWCMFDSCYFSDDAVDIPVIGRLFIGGLHGKMTASLVFRVFNDRYGGVSSVVLHLDKYSYPTGAANIDMYDKPAMQKALAENYLRILVNVGEPTFIGKCVQIDPYLDFSTQDVHCAGEWCLNADSRLTAKDGVFCRTCMDYRCVTCFQRHQTDFSVRHVPVYKFRRHSPEPLSSPKLLPPAPDSGPDDSGNESFTSSDSSGLDTPISVMNFLFQDEEPPCPAVFPELRAGLDLSDVAGGSIWTEGVGFLGV